MRPLYICTKTLARPIILCIALLLRESLIANPPPPPPGGYGNSGCFCEAGYGNSGSGSGLAYFPEGNWVPFCITDPNDPNNATCHYPVIDVMSFVSDKVEPATLGYATKVAGGVGFQSGTLVCLQNPSCLKTWHPIIDNVSWSHTSVFSNPGNASICSATGSGVTFSKEFTPTSVLVYFQVKIKSGLPPNSFAINWTSTRTVGPIILPILPPAQLAYWKFNTGFFGEAGQQPLNMLGGISVPNWNGNALKVDQGNNPILNYRALENGGSPNATRNVGTIRFWYCPSWSSGYMPGQSPAKLFEMNSDNGASALTLQISQVGNSTMLELVTSSSSSICGGVSKMNFSRPISWTAGTWHQVAVTYTPQSTELFVDGVKVGNSGSGIDLISRVCNSISIGSGNQARGMYDELETFNYPLTASAISQDYQAALALDTDSDGIPNLTEYYGITDPNDPDTDADGCLDGSDDFPLITEGCSHNPSDTTPPVLQLIQPANAVLIP